MALPVHTPLCLSACIHTLNPAHTFILNRHGSARGQSSCWIKLGEKKTEYVGGAKMEKKEYCAQSKLFLTPREKKNNYYWCLDHYSVFNFTIKRKKGQYYQQSATNLMIFLTSSAMTM